MYPCTVVLFPFYKGNPHEPPPPPLPRARCSSQQLPAGDSDSHHMMSRNLQRTSVLELVLGASTILACTAGSSKLLVTLVVCYKLCRSTHHVPVLVTTVTSAVSEEKPQSPGPWTYTIGNQLPRLRRTPSSSRCSKQQQQTPQPQQQRAPEFEIDACSWKLMS
jgi:hypothetical protein